jgi:putative glutamine amidotransferase
VASNDSDSARRPVIGLTTYLEQSRSGVWDVPAAFLPKVYFEAVTRAGGTVVLLPPQPVDSSIADRLLDSIDGLIITGGKDVDAARYGQQPHALNDEPRTDRDDLEFVLLERAIARDLPYFGICRGMQVLNVLRGGTLIQHLPDVIGSERYNAGNGVFTPNPALTVPGTRLAELVGETVTVQSYHHQALDAVGEGLTVSARGDDGIIQAVDVDEMTFGIAVQWHPEESRDDLRLFAGLVEAAAEHAARAESQAVHA